MIHAGDITYSYIFEGSTHKSLDAMSLDVSKGELVAILGHNGCGKTTFARHLNALLPLQSGELTVAGLDASDSANLWKIRKSCGMVFQNPDNQFVSSLVEEDLAFAPRNFGVPEEEIPGRIRAALETVGMSGYEKHSPHMLSGGQKQRIAIAVVLTADADILVFDEATAMLDPEGRRSVLDTIRTLYEQGKTIVMISHYVEEAVFADRVVFVHDGQKLAEGTPREMLSDRELLARTGLSPPMAVSAYYDLRERGIELDRCPLTPEELAEEIAKL